MKKVIANEVKCPKCGNHAVELEAYVKNVWWEEYGIEGYCSRCEIYFYLDEREE